MGEISCCHLINLSTIMKQLKILGATPKYHLATLYSTTITVKTIIRIRNNITEAAAKTTHCTDNWLEVL